MISTIAQECVQNQDLQCESTSMKSADLIEPNNIKIELIPKESAKNETLSQRKSIQK